MVPHDLAMEFESIVQFGPRAQLSSPRREALPLLSKVLRKVIGVAVRVNFAWKRLAYRLRPPWAGKLTHLDHVTIPCGDLGIAEEFYVGLLGAQIVRRIDEPFLRRMGWPVERIEEAHAAHLSLTLGGGPRLDLFEYRAGAPPKDAPMHPHIAFMVGPGRFLEWKRRLEERGVLTAGPTRPGPPGQASFYFNDPFGNHLEIITLGFVDNDLPVGVPNRSKLDYSWIMGDRLRSGP